MKNKNIILKILFNIKNLKIFFLILISSLPSSTLVNAKNKSNHNLFQENSSINHLNNKNLSIINKNLISNLNKEVNQLKDDKYLNTLVEEVDKLTPYIDYKEDLKSGQKIDNEKQNNENLSNRSDLNSEERVKTSLEFEKNNKSLKINKKSKSELKTNTENKNNKVNKSNTFSNSNRTPPVGDISVGGFLIPSRGFLDIEGPNVTLNIKDTDALETIKFLAGLGNYGFLYVDNNSSDKDNSKNVKTTISATFNNQKYSIALNSLLMASNLQAKLENGIIFVGEDIFYKSLEPKFSKTYRLNQASAASVGDYLATLGAKISKVFVKSSAVSGDELGSGNFSTSGEIDETFINSYGVEGGPLNGLIGTVDLRLQTITLVGDKVLIKTAEKYIKAMDVRHKQVALSVKIIDVSLTKSDLTENRFDAKAGNTYIMNNGGLSISTSNENGWGNPPVGGAVNSVILSGSLGNNKFFNWLEKKIKNENAKIIASPTLILGESQEPIVAGAAAVDDSLGAATIGRPFANEGFIKVGETVVTSFDTTTTDGVTTCSATTGTAGITFGAKITKIDDNGFVTFSLSPAISSVTKTESIANCGTQSTLSVRKLDTGTVRVRDGKTLLLTGVLKDEDNVTTSKVPILGDVPLLGRLFRNNTTLKRKSELIILVTPNVVKDEDA